MFAGTPTGKMHIERNKKQMRFANTLDLAGTAINIADIAWYVNDRQQVI